MTYQNVLADTVSLDGAWNFTLGAGGTPSMIRIPGAWEAQGFSKHVDGPAFYRRTFEIPASMRGSRIFLEFDAVCHACEVRLNGASVGRHIGMRTPFALDVTDAARPGTANTVGVEVWKPGTRYPVRQRLAGFLPDVATTFGGIWQSCRVRGLRHAFADLSCMADPVAGEIRIQATAAAFATDAAPCGRHALVDDGGPPGCLVAAGGARHRGSGRTACRIRPGFTVPQLVAIAHAQALVTRKYTIESLRRRGGMGGYVITGLRDTPSPHPESWMTWAGPRGIPGPSLPSTATPSSAWRCRADAAGHTAATVQAGWIPTAGGRGKPAPGASW